MRIPTRSASAEPSVAAAPSSVKSTDAAADGANSKRRRFLFTLGLGSAGVAVSAKASVSTIAEAAATPQESADGRYRDTEHVRDYYRTAKL